jgi:hypothetical protein
MSDLLDPSKGSEGNAPAIAAMVVAAIHNKHRLSISSGS